MIQVYFSRKLALFATTCCSVVFFMCVFALGRLDHNTPMFARILLWIMIPLMIWGFIGYVRRLLNPPLMLTADRRGVMIFNDTTCTIIPNNGVFLPWHIVTDICYEERMATGYRTNRAKICVIKCTLSEDAPFPVEKHSLAYLPQEGNRVVCLDAFNGSISKRGLLEQLKTLWQSTRKGEPRVITH